MPLVKSGVKVLGKYGLKTGMQIAEDVISGQKPKRALQRRTKQAGSELLGRTLHQFILEPPGKLYNRTTWGTQETARTAER